MKYEIAATFLKGNCGGTLTWTSEAPRGADGGGGGAERKLAFTVKQAGYHRLHGELLWCEDKLKHTSKQSY